MGGCAQAGKIVSTDLTNAAQGAAPRATRKGHAGSR
jgi:hypothetical protein